MAAWRAEERFMSTPLRDDQGCRRLEKSEREWRKNVKELPLIGDLALVSDLENCKY